MSKTVLDFFRTSKTIVQNAKEVPARPWLRLNCFRVLQMDRETEIATENLGATISDKDKPFFWSRYWHNNKYSPNAIRREFPLLTIFETENSGKTDEVFSRFHEVYTFDISVLDVYRDDCNGKPGCEGRTINEIYIDTKVLLQNYLRELGAAFEYGNELVGNMRMRFTPVEYNTERIYGTKCQVFFTTTSCPKIENGQLINYGVLANEEGCQDCQ